MQDINTSSTAGLDKDDGKPQPPPSPTTKKLDIHSDSPLTQLVRHLSNGQIMGTGRATPKGSVTNLVRQDSFKPVTPYRLLGYQQAQDLIQKIGHDTKDLERRMVELEEEEQRVVGDLVRWRSTKRASVQVEVVQQAAQSELERPRSAELLGDEKVPEQQQQEPQQEQHERQKVHGRVHVFEQMQQQSVAAAVETPLNQSLSAGTAEPTTNGQQQPPTATTDEERQAQEDAELEREVRAEIERERQAEAEAEAQAQELAQSQTAASIVGDDVHRRASHTGPRVWSNTGRPVPELVYPKPSVVVFAGRRAVVLNKVKHDEKPATPFVVERAGGSLRQQLSSANRPMSMIEKRSESFTKLDAVPVHPAAANRNSVLERTDSMSKKIASLGNSAVSSHSSGEPSIIGQSLMQRRRTITDKIAQLGQTKEDLLKNKPLDGDRHRGEVAERVKEELALSRSESVAGAVAQATVERRRSVTFKEEPAVMPVEREPDQREEEIEWRPQSRSTSTGGATARRQSTVKKDPMAYDVFDMAKNLSSVKAVMSDLTPSANSGSSTPGGKRKEIITNVDTFARPAKVDVGFYDKAADPVLERRQSNAGQGKRGSVFQRQESFKREEPASAPAPAVRDTTRRRSLGNDFDASSIDDVSEALALVDSVLADVKTGKVTTVSPRLDESALPSGAQFKQPVREELKRRNSGSSEKQQRRDSGPKTAPVETVGTTSVVERRKSISQKIADLGKTKEDYLRDQPLDGERRRSAEPVVLAVAGAQAEPVVVRQDSFKKSGNNNNNASKRQSMVAEKSSSSLDKPEWTKKALRKASEPEAVRQADKRSTWFGAGSSSKVQEEETLEPPAPAGTYRPGSYNSTSTYIDIDKKLAEAKTSQSRPTSSSSSSSYATPRVDIDKMIAESKAASAPRPSSSTSGTTRTSYYTDPAFNEIEGKVIKNKASVDRSQPVPEFLIKKSSLKNPNELVGQAELERHQLSLTGKEGEKPPPLNPLARGGGGGSTANRPSATRTFDILKRDSTTALDKSPVTSSGNLAKSTTAKTTSSIASTPAKTARASDAIRTDYSSPSTTSNITSSRVTDTIRTDYSSSSPAPVRKRESSIPTGPEYRYETTVVRRRESQREIIEAEPSVRESALADIIHQKLRSITSAIQELGTTSVVTTATPVSNGHSSVAASAAPVRTSRASTTTPAPVPVVAVAAPPAVNEEPVQAYTSDSNASSYAPPPASYEPPQPSSVSQSFSQPATATVTAAAPPKPRPTSTSFSKKAASSLMDDVLSMALSGGGDAARATKPRAAAPVLTETPEEMQRRLEKEQYEEERRQFEVQQQQQQQQEQEQYQ